MKNLSTPGGALTEKLEVLVANHTRFIGEFERSLSNVNHFVALADRSLEQEPESTLTMLSQLLEIDLLGHLQHLADEFRAVLDFVETSPLVEDAEPFRDRLLELAQQYERIEAQASEQVTRIETLVRALEV